MILFWNTNTVYSPLNLIYLTNAVRESFQSVEREGEKKCKFGHFFKDGEENYVQVLFAVASSEEQGRSDGGGEGQNKQPHSKGIRDACLEETDAATLFRKC